ncbi:MAG: VOC family protein [Devosia sp.]|uniref:VOC family protein n=1 Tax=Devosia sp. 66-22 TaxID=1895753 RepID=UPI000925A3BD|nr:VOC family protein [Devosia sp. 66-22]MBN9347375.1 VOC family protein [Devosia sp.]OJX46272.1 MAG: bleomycin resistance protein [Devosia sp. 66-22]
MTIQTTAHLNFRGQARAALDFYREVFGGHLVAVTYRDAGAVQDPAAADQIMWGQIAAENGFRVMAYDVPAARAWHPGEAPFFLSIRGADAAEIRGYWDRLVAGATLIQPIGPSGWSPLYGMLRDRFGVTWVLDVEAARS